MIYLYNDDYTRGLKTERRHTLKKRRWPLDATKSRRELVVVVVVVFTN